MNKDTIQPSYYAIIPASIRYSRLLKANEKLLYGEITALTQSNGKCWASNSYFAELYGVSKTSISKWIGNLVKNHFIKSVIIYKNGTTQIDKRYLTIVTDPIEEKLKGGIEEKLKVNTTRVNTTSNNKKYIKREENKKSPQKKDSNIPKEEKQVKDSNKAPNQELIDSHQHKQLIKDFIEHRQEIKKPMTSKAIELLIKKIDKFEKDGHDIELIIENSIVNGYQGIFAPKQQNNQQRQKSQADRTEEFLNKAYAREEKERISQNESFEDTEVISIRHNEDIPF